jgi:hypothetical protein
MSELHEVRLTLWLDWCQFGRTVWTNAMTKTGLRVLRNVGFEFAPLALFRANLFALGTNWQ